MKEAMIAAALLFVFVRAPVLAQRPASQVDATGAETIDSLVARALQQSPRIRAARDRVHASRSRVSPAGSLPDPMLSVGFENLPFRREAGATESGLPDMMTMKTAGIGQIIPFPGKLGLHRRIAVHEVESAEAMLVANQVEIANDVKQAYYAIAYLDRSYEILERNREVLTDLIHTTESRYAVGTGEQPDVLKARIEAARLAEEAVAVTEERRATLARLNGLLDRDTDTQLHAAQVPPHLVRAAVASDAGDVRFTSVTLGSRASDSPLPSLAVLQNEAVRSNPELLAHEAMIRVRAARVELARRAHLPDFELAVTYGQRNGRSDMISAMVTIPIPVRKGRYQDELTNAENAELSALEAEHHDRVNSLRARVAELHAQLEAVRAQLALYVKAMLPQSSAALTSALASYQVGRIDFLTVLDNQTTLFEYEIAYHRGLTDFAMKLAQLEAAVGKEILP